MSARVMHVQYVHSKLLRAMYAYKITSKTGTLPGNVITVGHFNNGKKQRIILSIANFANCVSSRDAMFLDVHSLD